MGMIYLLLLNTFTSSWSQPFSPMMNWGGGGFPTFTSTSGWGLLSGVGTVTPGWGIGGQGSWGPQLPPSAVDPWGGLSPTTVSPMFANMGIQWANIGGMTGGAINRQTALTSIKSKGLNSGFDQTSVVGIASRVQENRAGNGSLPTSKGNITKVSNTTDKLFGSWQRDSSGKATFVVIKGAKPTNNNTWATFDLGPSWRTKGSRTNSTIMQSKGNQNKGTVQNTSLQNRASMPSMPSTHLHGTAAVSQGRTSDLLTRSRMHGIDIMGLLGFGSLGAFGLAVPTTQATFGSFDYMNPLMMAIRAGTVPTTIPPVSSNFGFASNGVRNADIRNTLNTQERIVPSSNTWTVGRKGPDASGIQGWPGGRVPNIQRWPSNSGVQNVRAVQLSNRQVGRFRPRMLVKTGPFRRVTVDTTTMQTTTTMEPYTEIPTEMVASSPAQGISSWNAAQPNQGSGNSGVHGSSGGAKRISGSWRGRGPGSGSATAATVKNGATSGFIGAGSNTRTTTPDITQFL